MAFGISDRLGDFACIYILPVPANLRSPRDGREHGNIPAPGLEWLKREAAFCGP